jgi:hypothetical protein
LVDKNDSLVKLRAQGWNQVDWEKNVTT